MSILTLGAAQGAEVLVEATGPDAKDAVKALGELLISGFPAKAETGDASAG